MLAVEHRVGDDPRIAATGPLADKPRAAARAHGFVWRKLGRQTAQDLQRVPSAELRPGQLDTDSLPPYELLDDILDDYVEGDRGYDDLLAQGFPGEVIDRVLRMVDAAEYKRRQYPPGTKITLKAFGRDRRLPITNAWREG